MLLPVVAIAQSRLPPCPSDTNVVWNNCFGTRILSDGSKYVGEFRDGKPNGQGTYTSANGDNYFGEYRDGMRNGQGIEYAADGRIIGSGFYRDGKLVRPNNLPPSTVGSTVRLVRDGGTLKIPGLIYGVIPLLFTVDSGAADVSIPGDVLLTLIRTGTVSEYDFIGEQTYVMADGSKVKSKTFRIRQLKVGDKVVTNVIGSIAGIDGSLLLGQSFLSRFRSVKFDYSQGVLVLE